jgi:hypothetical protein
LGPDLGYIENIESVRFSILLGHDLHLKTP